jgi:hypothetical protein
MEKSTARQIPCERVGSLDCGLAQGYVDPLPDRAHEPSVLPGTPRIAVKGTQCGDAHRAHSSINSCLSQQVVFGHRARHAGAPDVKTPTGAFRTIPSANSLARVTELSGWPSSPRKNDVAGAGLAQLVDDLDTTARGAGVVDVAFRSLFSISLNTGPLPSQRI